MYWAGHLQIRNLICHLVHYVMVTHFIRPLYCNILLLIGYWYTCAVYIQQNAKNKLIINWHSILISCTITAKYNITQRIQVVYIMELGHSICHDLKQRLGSQGFGWFTSFFHSRNGDSWGFGAAEHLFSFLLNLYLALLVLMTSTQW